MQFDKCPFFASQHNFTATVGILQNTKPIIALGWDFEQPGSFAEAIREVLGDQGANVMLYPNDLLSKKMSDQELFNDFQLGMQNIQIME